VIRVEHIALEDITKLMSRGINTLFQDALRVSAGNPAFGRFLLNSVLSQKRAAARRARYDRNSLHVPAFMICSITGRCNLRCKGCYAHREFGGVPDELPAGRWLDIWREARDLGVSFILVAGGEPFVRQDVIEAIRQVPEIIFPVFTNGLLLRDETLEHLKGANNLVPVISLEGFQHETDERRGEGVYACLEETIHRLAAIKSFFGVSLTVTEANAGLVTSDEFVREIVAAGCRLLFFVEYVPVQEGTEHLALRQKARTMLRTRVRELRDAYTALFVAFPGDEEEMGGCLAAGRGFVHINPAGNLEPCPFAPYSDTSVCEMSLAEALRSRFLREVRSRHEVLNEGASGCALWENRELVRQLLSPTTSS
jgi:MoaA/NifB/PqqE/SkfB family radical SAM enzyme